MQMFSVYPIALNYLKQKIESRALELIPRCGLFNTFWIFLVCTHCCTDCREATTKQMSLDITNNFRIICKVNHKHKYKTLIIRHKYNKLYYIGTTKTM